MLHKVPNKLRVSFFCFITVAYSLFFVASVNAITPSPAMLEQLKALPKAEQRRLMAQYGMSPAMLNNLNKAGPKDKSKQPILDLPVRQDESQNNPQQEEVLKPFEEQELKPFGYDLFVGKSTTFAPLNDIPVPTGYMMGPGDQVDIQLFGNENQQYQLMVSRNGTLNIPQMRPISVVGLTFDEMKRKLIKTITNQYIGVEVSVSLGELRSIQVFIAGDAYKPGSYTVNSLSTITQALFVAGGVSDIGSLRNIQLKRNGQLVTTFDLYDLLMNGDVSKDRRLQSGDVLFIAPLGAIVRVKGQVRRPAIYELKGGETMAKLVRLAGGFKSGSYPAASIVERFNDYQLPSLINVDLTTRAGKNIAAKDGDTLNVQNTAKRVFEQVAVMGAVTRPGLYQWYAGIRISDLFKSVWRDLNNSADLEYVLIVREINSQGEITVQQVNLEQAMSKTASAANILLNPRDSILVFNDEATPPERTELDKLIFQKIKPYIVKPNQNIEISATANLFSVGFAKLTSTELYGKRDEKITEQELAAQIVKETLFRLFNDKKLLQIGSLLTRQELMYPVIEKLKSQRSSIRSAQLVSIDGEVRFPGLYPLTSNQTVAGLIAAAGGLNANAYIKRAELTRTKITSDFSSAVEHITFDLTALNANSQETLQNKDHLQIFTIPNWNKNLTVNISGEVRFPGNYTIQSGETMMAVIERAGRFTDKAFIEGAVFTRQSVIEQEKQQIVNMADQLRRDIATRTLSQEGTFISFDDASKVLQQLEDLEPVGRMVINLASLQKNYDPTKLGNGLNLNDGDQLFIPKQKQIVTVVGEVQHASSHFYKNQLDVDDYLRLAGGIKQRADDDRLYVIKADGSVMLPQSSYWFNNTDSIEPGDTIVVPLNTEYKDSLTLWSQVTGILYNTAVAIAAINGL